MIRYNPLEGKGVIQRVQFTIPGHPVGYLRMTQGQVKLMRIPRERVIAKSIKLWDRIKRYLDWKKYVQMSALLLKFPRKPASEYEKVCLNCMIYFENGVHSDPENVRKGIQDALFEGDKHVIGAYDYGYNKENPRTEIEIMWILTE